MPGAAEYEFGPFKFKQSIGLFCGHESISLPPKEAQLLELLLRKRGEVVTHREIEQNLWPGQEVSYASIARTVHALRQRLGGGRQCFVVTVPKRGYRLSAPVQLKTPPRRASVVAQAANTDRRTYAHYLEGQREANRGSPESQERAIALFQEAFRNDPGYATAPAAIAEIRSYQALRGYLMPENALKLGLLACKAALAVDPMHVSARCTQAWFNGIMNGELDDALLAIDDAMQADPEHAHGEFCRSFVLRALGRVDEGVIAAQKSLSLEPHALQGVHPVAWSLFCAGRTAEALELERAVVAERPYVDVAQAFVAVFAAWLGYRDEADSACAELVRSHLAKPVMMTAVAYALARKGETREALSLASRLEQAGLPRAPRPMLAPIYVAAGYPDRALILLRQAHDERCPWFRVSPIDPRIEELADWPQFQSLFE